MDSFDKSMLFAALACIVLQLSDSTLDDFVSLSLLAYAVGSFAVAGISKKSSGS